MQQQPLSTPVDQLDEADPAAIRRQAGVFAHISSLPGNRGIGEIGTEAWRFIDALSDMGVGLWQFLPVGPTGYGDSPYQSLSVFAGNVLLLDFGQFEQAGLITADELGPLEQLPIDHVDYGNLIQFKFSLMRKITARFAKRAGAEDRRAREEFLEANNDSWLHDYALFRVLKDIHDGRPWHEWDPEFIRRDPDALRRVTDDHAEGIAMLKTSQYLFDSQWRALRQYAVKKNVTLMGDVPIYLAHDSADAWANQNLLYLNELGQPIDVAGVPPDYFSADGQLWGNPLYRWDWHEADDFAWWKSRLNRAFEFTDLVRLDHFRGFEAYWAVPGDATTAKDGEWRPGPGERLFDALASETGSLALIAEDLGVVTESLESLLKYCGFPGMKVLQFMVNEHGFSLDRIPENSVCYTGTHDNDTTVGWFSGSKEDTRSSQEIHETQENVLRLTGGTKETVHLDMIDLAFQSPARIAIAPIQDILGLGSDARMNTPGRADGNWQWRLQEGQITPEVSAKVRAMIERSNRLL